MLAPAFTDRALMEQEPLLTYYFEVLVTKLKQRAGASAVPIDLMAYFNFVTFDIIRSVYHYLPLLSGICLTCTSDLCLGEAFGALEAEKYHTWIRFVARPSSTACSQVRTGIFSSQLS